ncbi:MAG TPA: hypothetical protein VMI54_23765 [Polyangiaceae bacterium]|nr:hypothetical protein [Polyangiaceae bacterium]
MNRFKPAVLTALAALPLIACGAAPEGDTSDGTAAEEMTTGAVKQPPRLIDFDSDGFGSAVTDGEDVTSVYTLRGVSFACEGSCYDHGVFARAPGHSGNGISVRAKYAAQNVPQPEFDASFGVVRATFIKPPSSVSIDAYGMHNPNSAPQVAPQGTLWIKAYDAYGNELAEDDYSAPLGQWQTLSVATGAYDIAYVEFSSSTAQAYPYAMMGRFDNLTFDQAPIAPPPPLQPVPTSTPVLPPRLQ